MFELEMVLHMYDYLIFNMSIMYNVYLSHANCNRSWKKHVIPTTVYSNLSTFILHLICTHTYIYTYTHIDLHTHT